MNEQTTGLKITTNGNFEAVGPTIADYVTEAKNELGTKITKVDNKVTKAKTMNVKYFCDFIPTEKKDPLYEKAMELVPHYAHDGDIGMDLVATSMEYDVENDRYVYHTGFYAETGRGDGCLIMPRSSNSKTDVYLPHSIGLVDTFTYRGEFLVVYKNRTSFQDRMVQLMLSTWLQMPWYKKLFTTYNKWCNKNMTQAALVVRETIINEAPYNVGDRIAQLVWLKFPSVTMTRVKSKDKLSKTERGEGGFGSTGK